MRAILKYSLLFILSSTFLLCNDRLLNIKTEIWYYQSWYLEYWENNSRDIKSFREDGKIIEHLIQEPDSKLNWNNKYRIDYAYNENGLLTEIVTLIWDGNRWKISTRLQIVYNDKNLIKERNFQLFQDEQWKYDVQFAYEYSESGNVLLETFSRWTNDGWEPYTKLIYKYDPLGLNTEILNTRFLDSIWVNYGLTINEYYGNRLLKLSTLYGWDIQKKSWFNYEKNFYDYDAENRLIEWINQQGDNDLWSNTFRETYDYHPFGNLYQKIRYRPIHDSWRYSTKLTYFFDNNQDSILILLEEWVDEAWINKERRIRENMLSVSQMAESQNILIYPNPTTGTIFVDFNGFMHPVNSFEILSLDGSLLIAGKLNFINNGKISIELNELMNGIYFIRFPDKTKEKAIKLILTR